MKLKECPFCEGTPKKDKLLREGYEGQENDQDAWAYFIICKSCSAQGGWSKCEAGSIRLWNMREEIARLKNLALEILHSITTSSKGSMGSIDNVYLPQISVDSTERWKEEIVREALEGE